MRTPSRLIDVAGSAVTVLLIFAAVPLVLVLVVGDPLSSGLGHHWGHAARVTMSVLAVVAWVAWAACCIQLTRAVVQHVRRGHIGLPNGAPLTERIAARIAVGILVFTTLGAPLVVAGTDSGASTTLIAPAGGTGTPAASAGAVTAAPSASSAAPAAYVVRPGDSLWSIANDALGDGADWTELFRLNVGRTMPDGRRFIDPSLIYPGWDLELPDGGTTAVAAANVVAPVAPVAPTAPVVAAAPLPVSTPTSTETPTPTPAGTETRRAGAPTDADAGDSHHRASSLPELAALGLGAIACAALARRSRRRRLLRQLTSEAPLAGPLSSSGSVDADVLLQRFRDVPALGALEYANFRLGHELGADQSSGPGFRAVCVTSFGVDFWLSHPGAAPPAGFSLVEEGQAWHIPHEELDTVDLARPHLPVILPIGDDDEGTWLVPVQPGTCLPLLGPAAPELWMAARCAQEAWTWSELVLITTDPAEAARRAPQALDLPILFFGDPALLAPDIRADISVVTCSPAPATDLSVLVDQHGASIHPLGVMVRPHLVTADAARLIDELVEMAPTAVAPEPTEADAGRTDAQEAHAPHAVESSAAVAALSPGPVELRLLTMTPRLDGLAEPLPPNRERRAIELVAYLALHRPDSVTSDRLRTRVLGSSDADAAAKTLFNTATAARRALGSDDLGAPLFPPGTRTGQYRVADGLTVDVQRAMTLAEVGSTAEDPQLAMVHLRAALELIESEPLANVLSGYTWWDSEGHSARCAAVLVNAACNLAALAVEAELFDLAQWGLERARLVDPYSESLSRAAMQVAAAAGDADRLRREWRECQRRMDELDPGSSPSPRTERLFGELAQQVLA